MSRMRDKVTVSKATDAKDRFVGYVARRLAPCNQVHEGHSKKKNHAIINLNEAIRSCPDCAAVLTDQPQPVVS